MARKPKWGAQFITEPVRCAFIYLADKDPGAPGYNAKPVYSLTALVPKDDHKVLKSFEEPILQISGVNDIHDLDSNPFKYGAGKKIGQIKDGDIHHTDLDGYTGHLYTRITSNKEPEIFMYNDQGDIEAITDKEVIRKEFYSGAWYSLMLLPAYYEEIVSKTTERSVSFFLQGVLKVKDDQRFGTKVDIKQAFLSSLGSQNPQVSAPKAEEAPQQLASDDLKSKFQQSSKPKKANLSDVLN